MLNPDKIILVGFSKAKSWTLGWFVSKMIRIFLGTPYSHVYIQIFDRGVPLIFEASWTGVRYTTLERFKKRNDIVDVFFLKSSEQDINSIKRTCNAMVGTEYAYLQLLGFPIRRLLRNMFGISIDNNPVSRGLGRQVCSETVGLILQHHWKYKFEVSADLLTPKDIHKAVMKNYTISLVDDSRKGK